MKEIGEVAGAIDSETRGSDSETRGSDSTPSCPSGGPGRYDLPAGWIEAVDLRESGDARPAKGRGAGELIETDATNGVDAADVTLIAGTEVGGDG